jgi:hypothetical protein
MSRLDLPAQNAIRAQANTAITPRQQFMGKIESYTTSLGNGNAKTSKSTSRKAKWSLVVTQKIEGLRTRFTADLQALQLLLQNETL